MFLIPTYRLITISTAVINDLDYQNWLNLSQDIWILKMNENF
jgi:hypothetical protein